MRVPKGKGAKILYLDYDGVLHHEDVWRHPRRGLYFGAKGKGHTLFENAALLERLLEPYPDVFIVLSTSWVPSLRYSYAAAKLTPGLKKRVIGATFHTRMNRNVFNRLTRAHQVLDDVDRRQPGAWVAIDDALGWPFEAESHFVPSDPADGIAEPSVTKDLENKLRLNFGKPLRPADGPCLQPEEGERVQVEQPEPGSTAPGIASTLPLHEMSVIADIEPIPTGIMDMKRNELPLMRDDSIEQARMVGGRLARLRHARGLRQEDAAIRAGVSRSTAVLIEKGDVRRTLAQVLRYLDAVAPGVSLLSLLKADDPSLDALAREEETKRTRVLSAEELKKYDF